jgi:16S rRNA (guanine527-N7)-methyltransferase
VEKKTLRALGEILRTRVSGFMQIGSSQWTNIIRQGAQDLGVDVSPEQANRFSTHARELMKWNRRINLTAITDPFEIAVKHFIDSIATAPLIPPKISMLDIGSGGGFPGIPLKTVIPGLTVMLVDASRKKVSFLKHICRTLKLDKIDACKIRGEDIRIGPSRKNAGNELLGAPYQRVTPVSPKPFDVVISRAVASLTEFVTMALPVLAGEGLIVAMGGRVTNTEIESLREYGSNDPIASSMAGNGLSITLKLYKLPFLEAQRSLVLVRRRS